MLRYARIEVSMLHTIGYEGLTIGEFLDILSIHNIDLVVDVRELPLSRKRGFSKKVLAHKLGENGIAYRHERDLGAPRQVRHKLRDGGSWEDYEKSFLTHLEDNLETVRAISTLALNKKIALLCFEYDYTVCHRSLIARKMIELGWITTVCHLPRIAKVGQQSSLSAV